MHYYQRILTLKRCLMCSIYTPFHPFIRLRTNPARCDLTCSLGNYDSLHVFKHWIGWFPIIFYCLNRKIITTGVRISRFQIFKWRYLFFAIKWKVNIFKRAKTRRLTISMNAGKSPCDVILVPAAACKATWVRGYECRYDAGCLLPSMAIA